MNHKPYNHWILDDAPLNPEQQQALTNHLDNCPLCQQLKMGWEMSEQLILNTPQHPPAPGFTQRWNVSLAKRKRRHGLLRLRLSILGTLLLILTSFITYLVATGSLIHWLAYLFNFLSEAIFTITKGLTGLETLISRIPAPVPLAAGLLLVGLINALRFFLLLTCWQYFRKEFSFNEVKID